MITLVSSPKQLILTKTTVPEYLRYFWSIEFMKWEHTDIWNQWRSRGASFCFCQFHKMFSSINFMLLWGFALLHYSVAESSPGFLSRMHPTLLLRYSVSENIPEEGVVSDFSDNAVHVSLNFGHYALKVWFVGKFSFFQCIKLLNT